jgi:hypothetical protein
MKKCVNCLAVFLLIALLSAPISFGKNTAAGDSNIEPDKNSEEDLAKASQNPVADLISLPLQNNTNFEFGPREKTQNVLNVQPVIPFHLTPEWNLINRTIIPVISQPGFTPDQDRKEGLGDINTTLFLSPAKPGKLIWGVGPIFVFPSATDERLGTEKWSAGPSAAVLTIHGPWVIGLLANNVWSFAGDSDRDDVNAFLLQYFINYNLPDGWYLTSSPIITANWEANSDNTWTVPVGGGFGKLTRVGKVGLPIDVQLQGFYNVEKPDDIGPDWSIRFQVKFLFPK